MERLRDMDRTSWQVAVQWAQANLFSSWWSTLLTLLGALISYWVIHAVVDFGRYREATQIRRSPSRT